MPGISKLTKSMLSIHTHRRKQKFFFLTFFTLVFSRRYATPDSDTSVMLTELGQNLVVCLDFVVASHKLCRKCQG